MRSDYRPIQNGADFVDFELQLLEYPEPSPAIGPIREAVVDGLPRAEALRQISPWNTGLGAKEDGVDELPIPNLGSRALAFLRKQLAKPQPLFVGQSVSVHRKLGSHSGSQRKIPAKIRDSPISQSERESQEGGKTGSHGDYSQIPFVDVRRSDGSPLLARHQQGTDGLSNNQNFPPSRLPVI